MRRRGGVGHWLTSKGHGTQLCIGGRATEISSVCVVTAS